MYVQVGSARRVGMCVHRAAVVLGDGRSSHIIILYVRWT